MEIGFVPLCLTFWYNGKMLNWLGVILGTLWVVGIVPALLIFTVKHQKKVEQKQPPRGLQFHGEDLQLEEFSISNFQERSDNIYVVPHSRADPLGILSHTLPNQAT